MDLMIHGGLGDAIICNGLVRNLCKNYDVLNLFVNSIHIQAINFMFRDLKNLNYIVCSWTEKYIFIGNITEDNSDFYKWFKSFPENVINDRLHSNGLSIYNSSNLIKVTNSDKLVSLDRAFYKCANVDFEKKWSDFYLERDYENEKKLFDSLGIIEDKYIFIQEDSKRGFLLNRNKINSTLPIISSSEIKTIFFDFCYIIENANEIHMMASSMYHLVEHLDVKTEKLYCHWSSKPQGNRIVDEPVLKKKWTYL